MTRPSSDGEVTGHETIQTLLGREPGWSEIEAGMLEHPMRFIGRRHRDEHVRKHVLGARSEKWHQLLDPALLEAVRSGDDASGTFDRLARRYNEVLAETMREALSVPIGPARRVVRLVRFEVLPPAAGGESGVIGGFRAIQRSLLAWCPRRRLRIVAGMSVSEPGVTSYRLLTGYRSDLHGSARQFDRMVLRRLADRPERSQERLLDPLPDAASLPAASGAHG